MVQQKKNIGKYLALLILLLVSVVVTTVQAADVISEVFTAQSATASGSNNSIISVDANLEYINKGNNSSIIGNYFSGEYYDSVYGFFETDWSTNPNQNIRVIGSTSACGNSYGYKLGGYAYSPAYGFVDFDFNNSIFVYYCMGDGLLYGFSYSDTLGLQNFEGISFDIVSGSNLTPVIPTGTGAFVNDETQIIEKLPNSEEEESDPVQVEDDSNYSNKTIQNEILEFNAQKENLFYIIK